MCMCVCINIRNKTKTYMQIYSDIYIYILFFMPMCPFYSWAFASTTFSKRSQMHGARRQGRWRHGGGQRVKAMPSS